MDVESNNGGTEFCLGSHFNTKFFTEDIVWQDNAKVPSDGEYDSVSDGGDC